MKQNPKKKLCWNCEGSVSVTDEICPYCGVSVVPASLDGSNNGFTPPYRMGGGHNADIPRSPYASQEERNVETEEVVKKDSDDTETSMDEFKKVLIAVVLLLTGSVFFLFGLVLALFSNHGVFILKWDASMWFIYSCLSIPLLLFGWRALLKIENDK